MENELMEAGKLSREEWREICQHDPEHIRLELWRWCERRNRLVYFLRVHAPLTVINDELKALQEVTETLTKRKQELIEFMVGWVSGRMHRPSKN